MLEKERTMKYDFIKAKPYTVGEMTKDDKIILSFDRKHHIKLSRLAKVIFDKFDGNSTLEEIQVSLLHENVSISLDELSEFVEKILVPNALIEGTEYKPNKDSLLWVKVNLFETDRLSFIFDKLTFFYNIKVVFLMLIMIGCTIAYSTYEIITNKVALHSVNSLKILLIVAIDMIIHEVGHIVAAYKYNVKVGKIGFGIFLFYPVMYVDMSNIWRCKNTKRMVVDIGGTYFQLFLLIVLAIIAAITGDMNYHVANVSIFLAVIVNLLPIIKLDGYWLFCDALGLDNLSKNSFDRLKSEHQKHETSSASKSKQYMIFSDLYLVTIIVALIITIGYSINIIMNWKNLQNSINTIYLDFARLDVNKGLFHLNEIFLYILPLIFVIFMSFSSIIKRIIRRIT